jgi:long-chain acyl-CoA synthetase
MMAPSDHAVIEGVQVQEHAIPCLVEPTRQGNLSDLPLRNAREIPDKAVYAVREVDRWRDVTAREFSQQVDALAKGIMAAGVQAGDRVGIMSRTRYEWSLTDFAVWTAGAVSVTIYETSSAEQVEWILGNSEAVAVVVESAAHAAVVAGVHADLPALRDVWRIDGGGLDELARAGAEVSDDELSARRHTACRSDLATIIYTSGTTGRPKGCMLTHGNFQDLAENCVAAVPEVFDRPVVSTLLFLPLAHVFARLIEILCAQAGATMAHSADMTRLLNDFATFRPTFILAVPRVFEKIYNGAEQKAIGEGRGRIFAIATATAVAWSQSQDSGKAGFALRVRHAVFDRLVYSKLRAAMGGRVLYAVSGGAPLSTRLGHFFRGVGVTILEGYGLTETAAPATMNRPASMKIGTVGPPMPGVGVRIADDGEILIRGINVFKGYWNNQTATDDVLRDGWFHSGDLGSLDEDGLLRITGRKKEILVTSGGKNVAPAVLEDRLRAHPLVSQCIVVGDGKAFIAALLTIDQEMYPIWAKNVGLHGVDLDAARTNERVLAELQKAIDRANHAVSKAEAIRRFAVLPGDLTEESGHLTPSLKLKRNVVMLDYREYVEQLYDNPRTG